MAELVLESDFLRVTFPGDRAGFAHIWVKGYNAGTAIPTETNYLSEGGELSLLRGNYHGIYANGAEYWSGEVNWFAYKTTASSEDLYGSRDPFGGVEVEVVKVVSGDVVPVGSDRAISSQELTFFLSPDGKGLLKRVRLVMKKLGADAGSLKTVDVMDYVSCGPVSYHRGMRFYRYGFEVLGFDFADVGALLSAWDFSPNLTPALARASLYPNLVPGFDSVEWTVESGAPSVLASDRVRVSAGEALYLWRQDAYPAGRRLVLDFTVENLSGELEVQFGVWRNPRGTGEPLEELRISQAGDFHLEVQGGEGPEFLFLRILGVSGSGEVVRPCVRYVLAGAGYATYDGSYLGHTSLCNCLRLQSSDPYGEEMVYRFPALRRVTGAGGVRLAVRSLDGTPIEDGAFEVIFQLADGTWVSSAVENMFVDYNDTYPEGSWARYNLWADGIFGVALPEGVEEIQAVGVRFLTHQAIDWLVDGFAVPGWLEEEWGTGAEQRFRLGMPPATCRWETPEVLRGVQGAYHQGTQSVSGERMPIVVVLGDQPYGEYMPLTFQDVVGVDAVYLLEETSCDLAFAAWEDQGKDLAYDVSGIADFEYPLRVENLSQNREYRIVRFTEGRVVVDISREDYALTDTLRLSYVRRSLVDGSHWSLAQNRYGKWCIKWAYDAWTVAHNREMAYVDYQVAARTDDSIGCAVGGASACVQQVRQSAQDLREGAPYMTTVLRLTFSDPGNEVAEGLLGYFPLVGVSGEALYAQAEACSSLLDDLSLNARTEPLSPAPRNYSLIPHVAFGGEYIAANPLDYLQEVNSCLVQAGASNAIVSGGSLSYLRDRDLGAWWWWSGALRDHGVDYIAATRNMLRRALPESSVRCRLNAHRYLIELSCFAYEHSRRHPDQASIDYTGQEARRRVWYYQADDGRYFTVTRAFADFATEYYQPQVVEGTTYYYRYHYVQVIPAFWSVVTPASYWGDSTQTIYDLLARRIDYVCGHYDADGVLISELIYYRHSFGPRELELYNAWRVQQGLSTVTDWPRDAETGYVLVDEETIWGFKSYYVTEFLRQMGAIAHGQGKLLGCNVNVQSVIPIAQPEAAVWQPYNVLSGKYGDCVDTLDYSLSRYGTLYSDLLRWDVCDLLYVWLYYRYSAFGMRAVWDFIRRFSAYKERLLLGVGLFPKEDPPPADEVVYVLQRLLREGWQVVYAGYPPMLIQGAAWSGVWEELAGYLPQVEYLPESGEIKVSPGQAKDVPLYVRF